MGIYEIRVKGHLDQHWSDWFDGLTITHHNGCTILRGPLADEAALHGVLIKVRDLALPLLGLCWKEEHDETSNGTGTTVKRSENGLEASGSNLNEEEIGR